MDLPTFDQLAATFKTASDLELPPYNWIPPKWDELIQEGNVRKFPDNCRDEGSFAQTTEAQEKEVAVLSAEAKKVKGRGAPATRNGAQVTPWDDFNHVDPHGFSENDVNQLEAAAGSQNAQVKKLRTLINSQGMRNLDAVFQWILANFRVLCEGMNDDLVQSNSTGYDDKWKRYIDLLRDLDNHQPENQNQARPFLAEMGPGERGFGRTTKWLHIAPVIVNGQIIGLRVIVRWNPHSSSSGVPILHN